MNSQILIGLSVNEKGQTGLSDDVEEETREKICFKSAVQRRKVRVNDKSILASRDWP